MGCKIPVRKRTAVVVRDQGICQESGKVADHVTIFPKSFRAIKTYEKKIIFRDVYYYPFDIDHIIPRCMGGTNDMDNLRLCCRHCNRKKGSKERGVRHQVV